MILYNQNIWGNTDQPVGNRHIMIREMIEEICPDVVTMQECNPTRSRVGEYPMQEILQPEYLEVLPEKADANYAPIFYRAETVEFVEGGFCPFSGKNFGTSKSFTWAVFVERATGKRFGVVSMHFWFKAIDETDAEQRRENAREVCGAVNEIKNKYSIPVLAAGDLNSTDATNHTLAGYEEMIYQGMKDVRELAKHSCDTHTIHSYPVHDENGNYISADEPYRTIDYVLVSDENLIDAESFEVSTHQKALLSSDHCPMVIAFYL
ncbi:MAG: hypothetical protein IJB84_05555 [Lachnospiraceae bacterium]|nr:hypothetical protein [Lachnospiraceae bacterium]